MWEASPPPPRALGGFRALAIPDYRRLWLCIAAANSGRWVLALGVGWLLFNLTHSSFWVGASFFCIQGPALVVAPLAGVWADRHSRRALLALALCLAALGTAALAAMTLLGQASLPLVLLATLCCGVAFSIQGTAWSALTPAIVPRTWLANANALQGTARQGAEFLGPAIASPLLVAFGPGQVFALACCCYCLAIPLAWRVRERPRPAPARVAHPFLPLMEGLRYVRRRPMLSSVILLVAVHCSLTMTYQGMLPQFAREVIGGSGDIYGALMASVGLGAMIGTLALAALVHRRHLGIAYAATALASGVALVLLGRSHQHALTLAFALMTGASQAAFMAISLTFLQELTADAFLGRVTGLYNFLASGTMAFLSWGFGGLASVIPPGVVMLLAGGAFVSILAFATARFAAVRLLYAGGSPAMGALAISTPAAAGD